MKIALLLQHYFPYGGLQRDCFKMSLRLVAHGHDVSIATRSWEGGEPEGVTVVELGNNGLSNMAMDKRYDRDVSSWLKKEGFACVVGFSRLATAMDFYYAADPCYDVRIRRNKPFWYRFTPRYRHSYRLEKHLFSQGAKVKLLLLTAMEIPDYQRIYNTEISRMLVLPPCIQKRDLSFEGKLSLRQEVRVSEEWCDESVVLFVGSGYATKGLDRAIHACAVNQCQLYVAGAGKTHQYQALAKKLGIDDRVHFLGGRDDAWKLMVGADLLIHPARSENTGTVLLEAISAGTGVLCTDRCGFANHVDASASGCVLPSPFNQGALNTALTELLTESWEDRMKSALNYASSEDLYTGMESAVSYIDTFSRH